MKRVHLHAPERERDAGIPSPERRERGREDGRERETLVYPHLRGEREGDEKGARE